MPSATRWRGGSPPTSSPLTSIVPASGRQEAGERQLELDLAVAVDAGDAEDLAGVDGQGVDRQPTDPQAIDLDDDPTVADRPRPAHGRQLRPDHLVGEAGAGAVTDGSRRADDDAVAQHGDAIGGLDDLAQAVGDEHDRPPVSGEAASDAEQAIRFGVGEHGRRLVEQQHLRIGVEGAQQFEPLALADRHRRHRGRRVDLEVESLGELGEVDRRPVPRDVRRWRWARNSRRLSTAAIVGTRAKCCCTSVTPRSTASRGDAGANRSPARSTSPDDGRSRPPRMRIRVVLPAPFSPRIASTSPARMSRSTLAQAPGTSPKRRETPTTWRAGAEPASTLFRDERHLEGSRP